MSEAISDCEDIDFLDDLFADRDDESSDYESTFVKLLIESTEADNLQQVTKKKRIRIRRRVFAPRIIKRDIRRYYGMMFANAINSFDDNLLNSFLQTYTAPEFQVEKPGHQLLPLQSGPLFTQSFPTQTSPYTSTGIQWTQLHFKLLQSLCPDHTLEVVCSKIYSKYGTEKTVLYVDFKVSFTRLFDVHPTLLADNMLDSILLSLNNKDNFGGGNTETITTNDSGTTTDEKPIIVPFNPIDIIPPASIDPFQYFKNKVGTDMPMLQSPQSISFVARLVMHINEFKQLEKITVLENPAP